ncbi:hypothetical protein ACWGLG_33975 [Streptomyces antimycoticus]
MGELALGNPLQLSKAMRERLLAAVLALLGDPSLAGVPDTGRLGAVVLYAKSRAPQRRPDDNLTSIWGAELGRWLGMSESTAHHAALPSLRRSGAVRTRVVRDAQGHPTGLDCLVMPLWRARRAGAGHPLALSKAELAVLLRLCEVLFGPGWAPKGKEPVPAGLLAARTGRGAATDRLGLLLMVLSTNRRGWLQLCPGSVDTSRGRPAATVARLLGCSAAAGAKVLSRLQEHGVADVERRTTGSGLNGKSRVRLMPVAEAHGCAVREAHAAVNAVFSDLAGTACGDHGAAGDSETGVDAGDFGAGGGESAGVADLAGTAELHAGHASVVTPVVPPQLSGRFSGEGRGGEGRRPERACVREDQAADSGDTGAESTPPVAEDGPLRGEKPKESSVEGRDGQRAADAGAGGRPKAMGWNKAQQRRVGLPADLGLRVALGPVGWLWERLNGWQQDRVEAVAKRELGRLKNLLLMQPDAAPQLLADRLTDRLEEIGGEALVRSPYGWLIRKGLVQRPACSDMRCDDGIRLDTGGECENCGNVIHLRRARRARVAAQVDRELPGLEVAQRRQVLEDWLRQQAALDAEDFVWRREQAAAEQARQDVARAAAQERAEHERAAIAASEAVRRALPCEDCGQERAAGLCEACGYRRRTEALTVEAGLVAAAWSADLDDPDDVAAVTARVRQALETDIATAQREFMELVEPGELDTEPAAAAAALAFAALQAAQQAAREYRRCALAMLGRTEEAEAEARRAYVTEQKRRWFRANPNGADAVAAATKAADTARERTAQYLLAMRLEQLHEQTARDRLRELAARPLDGDTAGAVIA